MYYETLSLAIHCDDYFLHLPIDQMVDQVQIISISMELVLSWYTSKMILLIRPSHLPIQAEQA